jgi:hypothetical protein
MTGFAVVLVLVLIPLSALTIATRRQPVTVGSVSIKRKGQAMDDSAFITVGRASLDAVMRERDNAVAVAQWARAEMLDMAGREEQARKIAVKDRDVLIDTLRKDNAQLKADNAQLVTMAAQWAGAKDPARMTVIDRRRLLQLEDLEEQVKRIIGELVDVVDEPGYVPSDDGYYRDRE